jgi:hypothetical protein
MKFSLLFASIFVQAVLHKEFVGAKPDKLLVQRHARESRFGEHAAQAGFICRNSLIFKV